MAQILPMNTDLGEDMEGASIDVLFTAQLDQNETLVSINIIDYEPTPGITVDKNHLYGTYESVFNLGSDSLKYRDKDEFKTASSWEDLPPPEGVDLYLWKAPQGLTKTFSYTVELIYLYQEQSDGGASNRSGNRSGSDTTEPPPPVEKRLTKIYTKTIVGNWSRWADKLREYVYVRK